MAAFAASFVAPINAATGPTLDDITPAVVEIVFEEMRLTEVTAVKVVRDRWYDAITFRIWGTGRDSTVRQATGAVVGGDPRHDRAYSEYWTLIRGAGVRGAPRADKTCPSCGAPLDTNMAGECAHCGAKVTSGQFDWVLSKIEQDDSYTG